MRRLAVVFALTVLGLPAGTTAAEDSASEETAARAEPRELIGKVLQASDDRLVIDFRGAAVPFRVVATTRVEGVKAVRELEEGSHVRASYELKRNQNRLRSLTVMPDEPAARREEQGAGERAKGEASPGH